MLRWGATGRQDLTSNGGPKIDARAQTGGRHRRVAHSAQHRGGGETIEIEDIETRVEELERAAGTQKPGGRA
jgi:hypothetical protein